MFQFYSVHLSKVCLFLEFYTPGITSLSCSACAWCMHHLPRCVHANLYQDTIKLKDHHYDVDVFNYHHYTHLCCNESPGWTCLSSSLVSSFKNIYGTRQVAIPCIDRMPHNSCTNIRNLDVLYASFF